MMLSADWNREFNSQSIGTVNILINNVVCRNFSVFLFVVLDQARSSTCLAELWLVFCGITLPAEPFLLMFVDY